MVLLTYPKKEPGFTEENGRHMRGVDLLEAELSEKIRIEIKSAAGSGQRIPSTTSGTQLKRGRL